jgi:hypothetical protein
MCSTDFYTSKNNQPALCFFIFIWFSKSLAKTTGKLEEPFGKGGGRPEPKDCQPSEEKTVGKVAIFKG